MSTLVAVLYREGLIRATNVTFIFWDILYPIAYMLVFGVGVDHALGFRAPELAVSYDSFFLAGVLGMASFGIAANTAWSFFLDRDNGMFREMLTYPLSRSSYLAGKVLFNAVIALLQAAVTVTLATLLLDVQLRPSGLPLLLLGVVGGTAGWFFFYAIFALRMRRNDAFNTITSVFYFVFLFASSMFYPLDPLPAAFRVVALMNPITWQVDVLRYASIGYGSGSVVAIEAALFVVFSVVSFLIARRALWSQE
jgi:ABC-2 type transport system permease protein